MLTLGYTINEVMEKPINQILCSKSQSLGFYLAQCLLDKDFSNIQLSYVSNKGVTHHLCCSFRVRKDWRMQIIGAVCEAYDISRGSSPLRDSYSSSTLPSNDAIAQVQ